MRRLLIPACAALLLMLNNLLPTLAQEAPPVRKYPYQLTLGSQRIDIELYSSSEAKAGERAAAIMTTLRTRWQLLHQAARVADAARAGTVALGPEAYALFDKLREFCQLSKGAFDPTDQPLRDLWGFAPDALNYRVPRAEEIALAKQAVDCAQIELKPVPPTLFLANPRLRLQPERYAAGWLLDQVVPLLTELPAAMLRSGAVAYYHGAPPDALAWKVAVPNPRLPQETMSYLYLKNQALTILGDYQNYFLHNGIRYSSLLDARTGYPSPENVAVHVTAPTALDAELIAHASAVLDDDDTTALLKTLQRSSVYKIVDRNGLLLPLSY